MKVKAKSGKSRLLYLVIFLSISTFEITWSQTTPPISTNQPTESYLSDKEWAAKVFQNLITPSLSNEEIVILQKQLRLIDPQVEQIKKLNNAYQVQQKLWKEVEADTSGNYGVDEKTKKIDGEKSEKNHALCLELAKQLRDSLGIKGDDFLGWLNEEHFLKTRVAWIGKGLKNSSPEEITSAFLKDLDQEKRNKKIKVNKNAEHDWWFEKRAMFIACGLNAPTGKKAEPRRVELGKKQKEILNEMMSH